MAQQRVCRRRAGWLRRALPLAFLAFLALVGTVAWRRLARPPAFEPSAFIVIDLRAAVVPSAAVRASAGDVDVDGIDIPALHEVATAAARDPRVAGILLRVAGPPGGLGRTQGLRSILAEFRRSGKPVVAYAQATDTLGYLAASAASEVWLEAGSALHFTGLSVSAPFYGKALAARGLDVDLVRVGEFQGACEQLGTAEPSVLFSQTMEALAESLFVEVVGAVSRSRGITENRVRQLVDSAPLAADVARRERLIDALGERGDLERRLREAYGPEVRLVSAARYRDVLIPAPTPHRVAVVEVRGPIVEPTGGFRATTTRVADVESIVSALQRAEDDDGIDAVLLFVDSPGGTLAAAEAIRHQVLRTARRRSIVAALGDGASAAAYLVASAAHEIVAPSGALTGGIGVFGGKVVVTARLRATGVRVESYRRGARASFLDASVGFGIEERRVLEERTDADYKRLVGAIAASRRLDFEAVDRVARGRVWTGRQALELGLIDRLGGVDVALARLRALLDIGESEALEVVLPEAAGQRGTRRAPPGSDRGLAYADGARTETVDVPSELAAAVFVAELLDGRSSLSLAPLGLSIR